MEDKCSADITILESYISTRKIQQKTTHVRFRYRKPEATVLKDDGKAIDSATVAMKKVEQAEAEESKVLQKKAAEKEEDSRL